MISDDLGRSLPSLFRELIYGAPSEGAFVLNPADGGLLASLRGLYSADASRSSNGGASIAGAGREPVLSVAAQQRLPLSNR